MIQASRLEASTHLQRATQARTHAGIMFACMRPVAQDEQEDAAGSPPGGSPQGSRRSSSRRNSGASSKGSPTSSRRTSAAQNSSTSRRSQLDLQIRAMVQAGGGKAAANSSTSRRRSSQNSVFRWVLFLSGWIDRPAIRSPQRIAPHLAGQQVRALALRRQPAISQI